MIGSGIAAAFGGLRWSHAFAYIPAQVAGCIAGTVAANVMFDGQAPVRALAERLGCELDEHHESTVGGYLQKG